MSRIPLAGVLGLGCLLPSLASAAQISAEQAKAAAIDGMRKDSNDANLDMFDVLVGDAPMTYPELLATTHAPDVFRSKKWKARLAGRTFWLVKFRIRDDPNLIVAGGGAGVFVEAAKGTVLGI